jgi:hypothetical protein
MKISYSENGISKERQATDDEVLYIKSAQADAESSKNEEIEQKKSIATARENLCKKLGITIEDLKALGL